MKRVSVRDIAAGLGFSAFLSFVNLFGLAANLVIADGRLWRLAIHAIGLLASLWSFRYWGRRAEDEMRVWGMP